MTRTTKILLASIGMFLGSLLSDYVYGDGIQTDDLQQAATMALFAAKKPPPAG
jgi:hypothetical protein